MSVCLILSTNAKFRSRSNSKEFNDEISGQKKILSPDGKSGVSHRKSLIQRQLVKDEDGWNDMLSICNR